MARELDQLFWTLRAETKGLETDIRRAQDELKGLDRVGDETAEGLKDIGKAGSAALGDLARDLRQTGQSGQEAGENLGRGFRRGIDSIDPRALAQRLTGPLEAEFRARAADAAEALKAGLISEADFEDAGREAGRQFNEGLEGLAGQARGAGFGELEVQLGARMKGIGSSAGSEFAEAAKASAKAAEPGKAIIDQIRAEFQQSRGDAVEALARGLISPDEFERQGRRAAVRMRQAILSEMRKLGERGQLDQKTFQALADELEKAGATGGLKFGDAVDQGAQSRLKRLEGFIRGGFRAGIVGAMVFVAARVVRAWQDAAQKIRGLLERAGDVQAIRTAFESLATARGLDPSDLLARLERASRGTASGFDLMRTANEAMQAGLPGTEQDLARVLEVSRRLGKSLGVDAEESFRRFVQAVIRGRRQILDDIGVVVDFDEAHEALAKRLGTTVQKLTEEERAAARLEGALAGAETRVKSLGDEQFTTRERVQQLSTATRNFVDHMLVGIAESPRFTRQLEFMADAALGTADALDQVSIQSGATAATIIRTLGNPKVVAGLLFLGGPAAVADLIRALSGADTSVDSFTKRLLDLLGVTEDFTDAQGEMRQALEDTKRALDIRRARTLEELIPIGREVQREVQAINAQFEAGQVTREERERRLVLLQKQANLLFAQEARLKERASDAASPRIEFSEAEIAAARKRIEELRQTLEELERTGTEFSLLEDTPAPLREAVTQAVQLQREIRQLEADIATTGGASAKVLDALARKREQLAEARQRAADVAQTPEGQIAATALTARENLDELIEARDRLVSLGFEGLADAPPQLLEVFERIGENEERIARIADLTGDLAREDAALAQEAASLIGVLEQENDELRELASALGGVGAVLSDFPDLGAAVFAGLGPEAVAGVRTGLQAVQAALQEVEAARLDVDVARLIGDQERAGQAARRLDAAERRLAQTLGSVAQAIQQSNLPLKAKTELLKLLADLSGDAAESTSSLGKALDTFEGLARGVLSVADAMGELDDQTRRALQGAIDLASGIKAIASGNVIGGAAQAIGGAVGLISGIFGESPADRALREELGNTRIALERLRGDVRRLAEIMGDLTGRQVAGLEKLFADDRFQGPGVGRLQFPTIEILADEFDLSIADIEQLGQLTTQPVDAIIEFITGVDRSAESFARATTQWAALEQGFLEATDAAQTFEGQMRLIEQRAKVFPEAFDTAIERLDAMREAALAFAGVPDDVRRQIEALDFTTPEGRAAAEKFFQNLFEQIVAGDVRFEDMTREEATDFIIAMLEEVRAAAEQGDDVTGPDATAFRDVRVITEVSANRLIGVLQTIAIHDDRRDSLLASILGRLGGTIPSTSAVPSPGASAEASRLAELLGLIVAHDDRRDALLDTIRSLLGNAPTISSFRAPAIPNVVGLTPSGQANVLHIDRLEVHHNIDVPPGVDAREVVRIIRNEGEQIADDIDRILARRFRNELRSQGRLN